MDELTAAIRQHTRAEVAMERGRNRLYAAMVEAAIAGMPVLHIVRVTGYSRARVYEILERHGVVQPTRPRRQAA